MSWSDRLLPGSFKRIPFGVDEHDARFGRTIIAHRFPGSENHFSQDTGRNPRSFIVLAFIVGEDYDLERDRLLTALESPDPGQLIHPWLGPRFVHCEAVSLRETRSEQRVARFEIAFMEAGENLFPVLEERPESAVRSAVSDARGEADASFLDGFSPGASIEAIRNATAFVDSQLQRFSDIEREVGQIYSLEAAIAIANESASALLSAPARLLETLSGAMGRITGSSGNLFAVESLNRLGQGYGTSISPNAGADPSPLSKLNVRFYKETVFQRAESLSRILETPLAPGVIVPESRYRDALKTLVLDIELALTFITSFLEFEAFAGLKSVLLSLSTSSDVYALPDLKTYIAPHDMPLSLIAFKLYGTTDRALDLQRLNQIIDPLFIKKGTIVSYLDG